MVKNFHFISEVNITKKLTIPYIIHSSLPIPHTCPIHNIIQCFLQQYDAYFL